jgi:hypothetical protein
VVVSLIFSLGLNEAEVHRELAEEEDAAAAEDSLPLHGVTPSAMLVELLDIEDQQYVSCQPWQPSC